MVRRARVEYPGAMFHVIQRGNNREDVFERPEDKTYLIEQLHKSVAMVRYIHRNPVRAAICISVKDYPWSSDRFYRKMESGFVEFGLLLDMLSANSKQSVRKYSQLMEQDDNYVPEKLAITENTSPEGLNQSKEINGGRRPLDEILMDTGINGEELELIKRGSRMRRLTAAKKAYAKKSWDQGYSLGEIARHINISTVAVFKYLNRRNGE